MVMPRSPLRDRDEYQEVPVPERLRAELANHRLNRFRCRLEVGHDQGIASAWHRIERTHHRCADKVVGRRIGVHHRDDGDALFECADCGNFGAIGHADQHHPVPVVCARLEDRRAILAGATEKREGIGKIFDGKPRFFSKAVRGEMIGVAGRRETRPSPMPRSEASLRWDWAPSRSTDSKSPSTILAFSGSTVRVVWGIPRPPIRATSTLFTT